MLNHAEVAALRRRFPVVQKQIYVKRCSRSAGAAEMRQNLSMSEREGVAAQ